MDTTQYQDRTGNEAPLPMPDTDIARKWAEAAKRYHASAPAGWNGDVSTLLPITDQIAEELGVISDEATAEAEATDQWDTVAWIDQEAAKTEYGPMGE